MDSKGGWSSTCPYSDLWIIIHIMHNAHHTYNRNHRQIYKIAYYSYVVSVYQVQYFVLQKTCCTFSPQFKRAYSVPVNGFWTWLGASWIRTLECMVIVLFCLTTFELCDNTFCIPFDPYFQKVLQLLWV